MRDGCWWYLQKIGLLIGSLLIAIKKVLQIRETDADAGTVIHTVFTEGKG